LPSEYEKSFKEELWGCFKYIGIPMDTLMNMPVSDRKFYIMMHNNKHNKNESYHNEESEESNDRVELKEREKMEMLLKARER
jgi:hypothetical protein